MTTLDALILGVVALAAMAGFHRGFVIGALAFAGFAAGAWLGLRLGAALDDGGRTGAGLLLALVGGSLASGALGSLGARLRAKPKHGGRSTRRALEGLDRLLGAALTTAFALFVAWLAGAAALQPVVPPAVRAAVRDSVVLGRLEAALPAPDPILAALDRFGSLPRLRGPSADVSAPPRGLARDRDVQAASASVVRVLGTACGRATSGSGWVAARGIVVTNAHVVAGQRDTQVQLGGEGPLLDAETVSIDARNDVAVLRVTGLDAPALRMATEVDAGTAVVMLGFPENGPYRARSARLGAQETVLARSQPGRTPVRASVRLFRGRVRPGNSGGPLVDASGRVTATVFAARVEARSRTGFAVPNAAVRRALAGVGGPMATGPCADGRSRASRPSGATRRLTRPLHAGTRAVAG